MWKLAFTLLTCIVALTAAPQQATAGPCGLPDAGPLWIDYAGGNAPIVPRPGMILAGSSPSDKLAAARAAGAGVVYFDLHLNDRVGTPSAPADPAAIVNKANRFFDFAAATTGCSTPLIAENELFGSNTTSPWSATNAQYRANVLTFLQTLAARGARPFLLVSSPPYTGGAAGDWWRQVAQVSDIVQEFFTTPAGVFAQGPLLGSRTLRVSMRRAVANFTSVGIAPTRIGIMLEFESAPGQGGREGLKPAQAWFEVVKLEALAARQVAGELGVSTIWSWGWATFSAADQDPDKPAAVCVYLWARDQRLCDGSARAGPGFDASLTEGQIDLTAGIQCTLPVGQIAQQSVLPLAAATGDPELAASAVLEGLIVGAKAQVASAAVLAAERSVIREHFRGVRAYYLSDLARLHLTLVAARMVIAEEIGRAQIEAGLQAGRPTAAAIAAFYASYDGVQTRLVEARPAPWWLGGQTTGFAIGTVAPSPIFALPLGRPVTIVTVGGTFTVRALAQALPLSAIPLSLAQPAISAALGRDGQDDAYQDWLAQEETRALNSAICLRDDLPAVGDIDLSAYAPFLAMN
jgi:hypothetical protein